MNTKMGVETAFVLCIIGVVAWGNRIQVTPEADRPSLRVMLSQTAELQCCYKINRGSVSCSWIKIPGRANFSGMVNMSDQRLTREQTTASGIHCELLTIREVQFHDTGLYQCLLNHTDLKQSVVTHGTVLQIYMPIQKTLNISDGAKNMILIAEGILLFLSLLVPARTLIHKYNKLKEMEKKEKMKREEENIYEGLNLDECCTTYHKIQRSQVRGPYQDVTSGTDDEGVIEFEKP